ncbi:MAG: AsmA family protein, partial [Candidatus Rokubacteria bacterium]|nr:AsmA family protein [Candidatus Rokubacteria bacterium]
MKWLLVGLAAAVALAAAALAALPSLVGTPRVQALIVQSIAHVLGRPVTVSSVSVSVLPLPAVVLRDLEIAEDPAFGAAPFLRLNEAEVRLRLWPLVLFRVQLGDFVLKKPVIALVRAADGRWNV